jgi:uncharacterized SAM-binding protein YcdF (DUF218 family)
MRPGASDATEIIGWSWAQAALAVKPPRARRRLIVLGLPVLALAIAMGAGFFAFVHVLDRSEREPAGRTDGIVALTGGAERITEAINLLAKGYASRLLITGVNERTTRDEIARLNPGQRMLLDCCVDLDYRARNTIGNAIETRRWLRDNHFRSVIVVTSNYHMPRTLIELDNVLPEARVVPYPVVNEQRRPDDWWRHPATLRLLVSEYTKFLAGWVRTKFERDPERSGTAVLLGGQPIKMVERRQTR